MTTFQTGLQRRQLIAAAAGACGLGSFSRAALAQDFPNRPVRIITPFPVGSGPEERKEREKHTRRLVSMLARRGHSPGAAVQIVREALDEQAAHQ